MTNKQLILRVLIFLTTSLFLWYLAFAFIAMDASPASWHEGLRALYMLVAVVGTIPLAAGYSLVMDN